MDRRTVWAGERASSNAAPPMNIAPLVVWNTHFEGRKTGFSGYISSNTGFSMISTSFFRQVDMIRHRTLNKMHTLNKWVLAYEAHFGDAMKARLRRGFKCEHLLSW